MRAGATLGRFGTSGNSSEPQLHVYLQDRAAFGAPAQGLPIEVVDYEADGVSLSRGVPVRGQFVRTRP